MRSDHSNTDPDDQKKIQEEAHQKKPAQQNADSFSEIPPIDFKIFTLSRLPHLEEKELQHCQSYYVSRIKPAAEAAITHRDIHALRLALGPAFYKTRRELLKQIQAIFWSWLRAICQLTVFWTKAAIWFEFIDTKHYPKKNKLNDQQIEESRNVVRDRLEEEKKKPDNINKMVTGWIQYEPLVAVAREYITSLLDYEIKLIEKDPKHFLFNDYRKVLHSLNAAKADFESLREEEYKKHQPLEEDYIALTSGEYLAPQWQDFQRELEKNMNLAAGALTDQLLDLKASRFSEIGLAHKIFWENDDGERESLFDFAVEQYVASQDEVDKSHLVPLMEVLLEHGDKPSPNFQGQLDWPILALLFKHLDTSSDYSETIRKELAVYSQQSQEQLTTKWKSWYINSQIKEERRVDTQKLALILSDPQQLQMDQRLTLAVQRNKNQAKRHHSSDLYRRLDKLTRQKEHGQLVAVTTHTNETEMNERPSQRNNTPSFYALPRQQMRGHQNNNDKTKFNP